MDRISTQDPDDVKLAHRILSWLSYSPRPMTVEELQHALAIEPDTESFDFDMIIDENLLLSVCGGLVTIELGSRVIRLVHFTAQEYIAKVRQQFSRNAKLDILVSCLTYLQEKTFKSDMCLNWGGRFYDRAPECPCTGCHTSKSTSSRSRYGSFRCECQRCRECNRFLFHDYATQNWPLYVRGELEHDTRAVSAIIDFLSKDIIRGSFIDRNSEIASCKMASFFGTSFGVGQGLSRLNVAIILGLESICAQLLEDELPTDAGHAGQLSALHYAVGKDHVGITRLLLQTDAEVDRSRSSIAYSTPLLMAISLERLNVLRILTEDETLGTRKNPICQMALVAATSLGANAISVIKLLLEHGVPADSRESADEDTALHRADHVSVAKLLLDHGASVKTVDCFGRTPLHGAAENGYYEVAKVLLEYGADANATDCHLFTPLHRAACSGHRHLVKLLIENGTIQC